MTVWSASCFQETINMWCHCFDAEWVSLPVIIRLYCYIHHTVRTIVLYSRDHQGLGLATSHKPASLLSHDDVAVLVRSPKKSSYRPEMLSTSCYKILKILYLTEFSTDWWLPACLPSDSRNSTMAKATGLIFSLFNARGHQDHTK